MRKCFCFFLIISVFFLFSCTSKPESIVDDMASVYDSPIAPEDVDFLELEPLSEEDIIADLSVSTEITEFIDEEIVPYSPEGEEIEEGDSFFDSEELAPELESDKDSLELERSKSEEPEASISEKSDIKDTFLEDPKESPLADSKEPSLEPEPKIPSSEIISESPSPKEALPVEVERAEPSPEPIPMELPFAQEEKPDTKPPVGFSRTIRALAGQVVEIPYRGMGWIYTGERTSRPGLSYRGRRVDGEGLVFSFLAPGPGTWELMFYKQDFIEDYIIEDYLYLVVGATEEGLEAPSGLSGGDLPRLVAERWPPEPGAKELKEEKLKDIAEGEPEEADREGVILEGEEIKEEIALSADELYTRVKDLYTQSETASAIAMGENALLLYPEGTAAWYILMARLYEHDGPTRNIRRALAYYEKVLSDFPASSEVPEAERRIRYIERFFYGIR